MHTCPFCTPDARDIAAENDLAYARFDAFPANPGHMLIIPFRHTASYFELTAEEQAAIHALIGRCREIVEERMPPTATISGSTSAPRPGRV
jgi:diadenosine tetraphosphate (Ap4A) HIT family hydrolase